MNIFILVFNLKIYLQHNLLHFFKFIRLNGFYSVHNKNSQLIKLIHGLAVLSILRKKASPSFCDHGDVSLRHRI